MNLQRPKNARRTLASLGRYLLRDCPLYAQISRIQTGEMGGDDCATA